MALIKTADIQKTHRKKTISLFVFFLALIIVAVYFSSRWIHELVYPRTSSASYDEIINDAAKRHFIDPCLVKAVIWRESRFKADARGNRGEIGLMQIIPKFAVKDWERSHHTRVPCEGVLFDCRLNIEIGSWYLGRAAKYWKNKGYSQYAKLALCEYNAGRSKMASWSSPPRNGDVVEWIKIKSTRNYVCAITEKYLEYGSKREAK